MISESTIEKYLVKQIKKRNGQCVKLTGDVGIPDRLILLSPSIVVLVELKTAIGKLSPKQVWWGKTIQNLGLEYRVIRSLEDVNTLVSQYDKFVGNLQKN